MKPINILITLFVFAVVVATFQLITVKADSSFVKNLTVGSRGADVSALQQILINDGYLTVISSPSGYFGQATKNALVAYQNANGISPATGFFGVLTRAIINKLNTTSTIGTSHNTVKNNIVSNYQNTTDNNTANNQPVTSTLNTTLCNGIYYVACPAGEDFVCTSDGKAYCQINQQTQTANQKAAAIASYNTELQIYESEVTQYQNEIANLQVEANQPCSVMMSTPLSEFGGEQGIQAEYEAEMCNSYEQEIDNIVKEISQIEQAETYAKNEIFYIESLPTGQ